MTEEPLDALLEKLNAGDSTALDELFRAYEPYLRIVVRRRLSPPLRSKFDSLDIVQSVWADVIDGVGQARWKFENTQQLRAFLLKMTQNRFIDRLRQNRTAIERGTDGPQAKIDEIPNRHAARASEATHADDLWQQMLKACPPAHHQLLEMKRAGASLAEIAQRTGMHESSVRRVLYQVARDVARRRDGAAETGLR